MTSTPPLNGLLTALEIAAFREIGDGIFEPLDTVPAWYLEFCSDALSAAPVRLGELFPFIENFLIDARVFWSAAEPGQLRSGPWAQNNARGDESHFEAMAICHSGDRVLMIERFGAEFEATRAVLQRARDRALSIERLARIERAFWHTDAAVPGGAALQVTTFRLRQDGTYVDYGGESGDPAGEKNMSDLVSAEVAERFRTHVSSALESGLPHNFDYSLEGPGGTSEFEAYLTSCGRDEVLVQVRDVSALRRAEREIVETLERVRRHRDEILLVLNELRLGAVQVALDGRVIFLNDAAARLFGTESGSLEGSRLSEYERFGSEQVAKL